MLFFSKGIWQRNAYYFEGDSFDSCSGHPGPNGEYHHHLNPNCLYNSADSSKHSPLIGYAFDGFPIYGPFGYTSGNDSTSAIKRMITGYKARNITVRQTLASGQTLTSSQYGPVVNSTWPLGIFLLSLHEFILF